MNDGVQETRPPEPPPAPPEIPRQTEPRSEQAGDERGHESQSTAREETDAALKAEHGSAVQDDATDKVDDQSGGADQDDEGDSGAERTDKIHSRYPDGVPVYEGEQPDKVRGPDPAAEGSPHTVLKMDTVNDRVYKAREYGEGGVPVRDIDFTHPTYPNGRPRPDHTAPEQHRYTPNDPDNPRAGYKRGPGEPLDS